MKLVPRFNHSKAGLFMFNLCANASTTLYKHKGLYGLIQFTGGLPMILFGLIISLVLLCCGQKPIKTPFGGRFEIFKNGGGMDAGIVYIRGKKPGESLDSLDLHEMGHCLTQNVVLGPFFPFIVAIPSALRYGYDVIGGLKEAYDAVGFEDLASVGGEGFVKNK